MTRFTEWLAHKWNRGTVAAVAQDYQVAFSTAQGQRVLQHLLDSVYCTVYEGTDPIAAALHNGRRSLVQEILENIDLADSPEKYRVRTEERR